MLIEGCYNLKEKCIWIPVQKLDWLGFTWNFTEGTFRITTKRIEKLKDFLASISFRLSMWSNQNLHSPNASLLIIITEFQLTLFNIHSYVYLVLNLD
jgi:hypothetical protein